MSTNTKHVRYGLFINCLLFAFLVSLTTTSAFAYNVYYGQLHSHSKDSDGSGTPAQAYQYARDTAKLDFFSLADHCSYPYGKDDGLTVAEYQNQQSIANSYNQDGVYVTFWGFEWTSDDTSWGGPSTLLGKGHITVINSPDHCEADEEATNDLNELVDYLSTRDALAFFNHPGQYGYDFDNFNFNFSDKIVGMELWNRNSDYYGSGSWYHSALDKGWYIGATGSQDNHSANWGTMNEWRMAILAPELTRASLLEAMKARRFYSSRDKNLVLSFTCNGAQMGSMINGGSLNVVIEASDGNSEIFSRIDLLRNGAVIQTWTPNTTDPYVSTKVSGGLGDYFYVRAYQSGSGTAWQAISSPIFIISVYVDRVIDFNCDGNVSFGDFAVFGSRWLDSDCDTCGGADFTGDGAVNGADLSAFASEWLRLPDALGWWRLDEKDGNIAHDSIGGFDGTVHGDPNWLAQGGQLCGALELDGIDDYVSTGFVLDPAAGPFGIFAWMKGGAPGEVIISQMSGSGFARPLLCAHPHSGGLETMLMPPGRLGVRLTSEFVITDGKWHRLGLVWDGSYRYLYADGSEVASDLTAQLEPASATGGLLFGAEQYFAPLSFYGGLIDDVRVYDEVVDVDWQTESPVD